MAGDAFREPLHLPLPLLRKCAVVPSLGDAGDVVQRFSVTDEEEFFDHVTATGSGTSSDSAVISAGFSMPRIVRIVGATFERTPPPRSAPKRFFGSTRMSGTGFVVWAVCGWPVAGSNINSALPWSAV